MANGSVVSTGMDELRRSIEALPAAVQAAARRVARDTAHRVADLARQRVPVRTGALKGSIVVTEEDRRFRISVGRLDGPPIAMFLEYGTERMEARPFFTPALEIATRTYDRDLAAATEQAAKTA